MRRRNVLIRQASAMRGHAARKLRLGVIKPFGVTVVAGGCWLALQIAAPRPLRLIMRQAMRPPDASDGKPAPDHLEVVGAVLATDHGRAHRQGLGEFCVLLTVDEPIGLQFAIRGTARIIDTEMGN